jgi:hypothetical protein
MEWHNVRDFFPAELGGAMQDLTQQEKEQIKQARDTIESRAVTDKVTKMHLLGYLILEFGGKEFLDQLTKLYWERFPRSETASGSPASGPAATAPPAI